MFNTNNPWLQFVAVATTGFTPLAPLGMIATALSQLKAPQWMPVAPKRFAWVAGVIFVGAALPFCTVAISKRQEHAFFQEETMRFYLIGLASAGTVLLFMETSLGK